MPRRKRLEPIPVSVTGADIGKRIATRRIELGLTQVQLAQNIGLIQSLISAYERGIIRLTADMIVRFVQILGVSADFLLGIDCSAPDVPFPLKFTKRMAGIKKLTPSTQRIVFRLIDIYLIDESTNNQKPVHTEPEENRQDTVGTPRVSIDLKKQPLAMKPFQPSWNYEDREMLKMYYPRLGKKEILELFEKKSWGDCCVEAERLGIKRLVDDYKISRVKVKRRKKVSPRGPVYRWTDEDRRVIRAMYPEADKKDILCKLKHRTWDSIQKEASRQKIKRLVHDDDFL